MGGRSQKDDTRGFGRSGDGFSDRIVGLLDQRRVEEHGPESILLQELSSRPDRVGDDRAPSGVF